MLALISETNYIVQPVRKVELIASSKSPLATGLLESLRLATQDGSHLVDLCSPEDSAPAQATSVYVPAPADRDGMTPDLLEAERVFQNRAGCSRFILLSSTLIYGTGPARQSMVTEDYAASRTGQRGICDAWRSLEAMARRCIGEKALVILRPTIVVPTGTMLSRRLVRWLTVTLPGRDPVVQILSLSDLACAVLCAVDHDHAGIFNVAPDDAVPLRAAIHLAGNYRVSLPSSLQCLVRSRESLDYLRYPWTISNAKIKEKLGFVPTQSSVAVLVEERGQPKSKVIPEPTFDEFGMDKEYIRRCSKTLFKFLCDVYWRIDTQGTEHVPRVGPAVLVGTHRGFMPWDGIMALHLVVRETGRFPRFLTHPGLLKFPFLSSLMTKLGGVIACQASAGRILESGQLLGIYPEGVQGAFALHRTAYKLQPSWRNTFVKVALRHRAPIVPFVNVGSADSLPVFAQIKSRAWTRYADWPCIPISTFPFLPLPLPSKWHVQFLPPIHVEEQYPPHSAEDAALVKGIGSEVKGRMQAAMDKMVRERRSIFF